MDKIKLKQTLIDLEQHTINEANLNHEDFLTGNLLERGTVVDADDQSHHMASVEISESLDKQVHIHEDHLKTLKATSFEPTEVVKQGAVVSINGRCMVIAVSKPKFQFEGRDFIGISTNAPIYKELEGKKSGDKFTFNNIEFKIDEVN